ncbi:interleukin-36 alpha-like [Thamnophis elegans]|uniref:interleukin-36 alpha-like n=1 Tax=Thamnophis elegans TaxID=35005 RepID=UPI001378228A|nr:interleukin-36 alpha-like [Thamnophis elegans]XP_032080550.1 interleukin-36 alpha-like [Thamnophis elegans]
MTQPECQGNLNKFKQFEKGGDMANEVYKMSWEKQMEDLFKAFKPKRDSSSYIPAAAEKPWQFQFWDINNTFLRVVDKVLMTTPQISNSPGCSFDVVPNTALDSTRNPIFMGADNHVVSCIKSDDGQLQIQLMEEDIMRVYKTPEKFKNFTFYSTSDGKPEICTFESAEFPGWFISSSSEPNKPIGLNQKGGPENILFYFTKID